MSSPDCCAKRVARRSRGGFGVVRWALPAVGIALTPKCPACVAGYVALATGIGISMTAAAYLRTGILAACVICLVAAAAGRLRRTA